MKDDTGYRVYTVEWKGLGRPGFRARLAGGRPTYPGQASQFSPHPAPGRITVSALDADHAVEIGLAYLRVAHPEVYRFWETRIFEAEDDDDES